MSRNQSKAYHEGLQAGKKESATEFDNPYPEGSPNHSDWYNGFCYIRGAGDTMFATSE